ncbi:MAG TPA: AmmeMemoRadiSam system protein B [Planctomycetota bacterium]|nr:AmmeMemoRadiSam system protein B [Planctomycetota bacterium]
MFGARPDCDPDRPRLRQLEVQRRRERGQAGIVLVDPLGITPNQCYVPEALLPIVGRLDGTRTVPDIERELRARGYELPDGFVARLVQQLDGALMLDTPAARAAEEAAVRAFLRGSGGARPARHAGSAGYPADPDELRAHLAGLVPRAPRPSGPAPRGLVAPHIDLQRGADGYRAAYSWLGAREPADLYVIFGTGHKGPAAPVTGLLLDWDTPLGRVRSDLEFIERVHAHLGPIDPRDAFLHRDEHSIEFQVLMLAHLFGGRSFTVAGFLCGSLPSEDGDPGSEAWLQDLLAAFRTAAQESGKRVCWIAGADLAHLGPWFGDPAPVDASLLSRLERDDRARLAHLGIPAPGAFHREVVCAGNPDRICGTTPMYLCAALADAPAELLHYGQAVAEDGSQVVSFCSLGMG